MRNKELNFQLLKIIAMLMIVSHHLVAKNLFNIDTEIVGITINKLALQVLGNNAFIGNNLFFLVSAWFLSSKREESVDSKYSIKSCFRIEKTVLFYSYVMLTTMLFFGGGVNKSILLQSMFPTVTGMWWYPTTYMIFLMIWPFYHDALLRFSVEDLKRYILIVFSIWCLSTLIPFANLGANNLLGFLMLYAAVVLIKRLKIVFSKHRKLFLGFMLIPYVLAILSIVTLDFLGERVSAAATYSCYFMRGNYRPVSMMVSIGLFMWGTSWHLRTNRAIGYLADTTFGVYLFHMYPPIMKILFERIFLIQNVIDKSFAVLWLIAVTVVIFLVGALIDTVRKVLFYICDFLINQIRPKNNPSN